MKTDVLIVGGGAIGSAVACFMRTADPSVGVTVVERDSTYEFASTPRASGGIRRLFHLPENIELSNFSISFYDNHAQTLGIEGEDACIGLKKHGYLFVVPPSHLDTLKANHDRQMALGCNVVHLAPEQLKDRFPSMRVDDLGGGVWSPDDGWLDPWSVLGGFRKKAASLGAIYIEDEVTGFATDGHAVSSATLGSGHTIAAEHFVNAAGAWAQPVCRMLGLDVPIEPLRRFEHYWEAEDDVEPLPYIKDPFALAFRPEMSGYSGGVPSLKEPRGLNFAVDHEYFENIVWPALAHRFSAFERVKCRHTMPGLYDQNDFDGNMIIGAHPNGPANFHLLAGYSGHGLMHAPGSGRAMAELILKGRYETIDLTRFGWRRLVDGTPLREQGII